ncbi:hypothetical protein BHE74_00041530 [Ensete ventricosum]|nr:hypothetical protein BHE74_00041530 [Ensete ventricosum]
MVVISTEEDRRANQGNRDCDCLVRMVASNGLQLLEEKVQICLEKSFSPLMRGSRLCRSDDHEEGALEWDVTRARWDKKSRFARASSACVESGTDERRTRGIAIGRPMGTCCRLIARRELALRLGCGSG